MLLNIVCFDINLTWVLIHTWLIDSSVISHISMFMQDSLNCLKPSDGDRYIYVGDDKIVEVEPIRKLRYY